MNWRIRNDVDPFHCRFWEATTFGLFAALIEWKVEEATQRTAKMSEKTEKSLLINRSDVI